MADTTPSSVRDSENDIKKNRIRQKLVKSLQGFNFKQLIQKEIVNVFELEPKRVFEALYNLKLPSKKTSIVNLLDRRTKSFSFEEIKEMIQSLKLYRTAFCNKKNRWTVIDLMEPLEHMKWQTDLGAVKRNFLQAFRIKGLNADVKVIEHDDLVWAMLVENQLTRRRGVKQKPPVYLCYEINTPYLFISSTSKLNNNILECITKAMQFQKQKYHHLDGKDVASMLSLLKNRETYKENLKNIVYEDGAAEIGHRYVDFSQSRARENYINKVFDTKDPVNVDSFTYIVDAIWQPNDLVPEMAGEHVRVKTTIISKTGSIVDAVKDMVKTNTLATPLPSYLQELLKSGKNQVVMRSAGFNPGKPQ